MKTNPLDPTLRNLDTCGCCEGVRAETPLEAANRSGLPRIAFRSGTHSRFKASLLTALSAKGFPLLQGLRIREDDDFTIALLDGFAAMADVLTFYSERIANESCLRTATERRSVLELARAIGYELGSGVAARAWLAFAVDETPGAPGFARIPKRTKVQSIPGPDEKPQTFETTEEIEARKEWNCLRPRTTTLQTVTSNSTRLCLKGTATHLHPGDALLILSEDETLEQSEQPWLFCVIQTVTADPANDRTLVTFHSQFSSNGDAGSVTLAAPSVEVLALRQRALQCCADSGRPSVIDLDAVYAGITVGSWAVLTTPSSCAPCKIQSFTVGWRNNTEMKASDNSYPMVKASVLTVDMPINHAVFTVDDTVVFFQSERLELAETAVESPVTLDLIELDRLVSGLVPGRCVTVCGLPRARVSLSKYARGAVNLLFENDSVPHQMTDSDVLEMVEPPSRESDGRERWHLVPPSGPACFVVTSPGNLTVDEPGPDDAYAAPFIIKETGVSTDNLRTTIALNAVGQSSVSEPRLAPESVVIYANVAPATHGETTEEIVGGGDGTQKHQQFALKQRFLTYVPVDAPAGAESSLEVYVNDVKWTQVDYLYGCGPRDRVFVARRDDDGTTRLTFGDGRMGARLASGAENVRARYRKGIGAEGTIGRAGQLTLLMNRPLGVRAVTNPAQSSAGQDPEALEDARINAPLQALTLGRAVSLQDYEDFARAYAGVAKARAVWVWTSQGRGVFVSIAAPGGMPIAPSDDLAKRLAGALMDAGNPHTAVYVCPGSVTRFDISGDVAVGADRIPSHVKADMDAALRAAFRFEARQFGQEVALSEIMSVIHSVAGVKWVDVSGFDAVPSPAGLGGGKLLLPAARVAPGTAVDAAMASPAEILVLDDNGLANLEVRVL